MVALELGSGAWLLVLSLVSVLVLAEMIPRAIDKGTEINMSLFTRIAIGCLLFLVSWLFGTPQAARQIDVDVSIIFFFVLFRAAVCLLPARKDLPFFYI
jgi:predicted neutral ceramidase superfamily lipid hydrolase